TGVPVVQPDHGAFPEVILSTGGGILFPAEDTNALVDALARILNDHELRSQLAEAGFKAVHARRNSQHMARLTLDVLRAQAG
ncbi:MAG: glycosyltransferase, partial [Planctomycetota bacterium]|nr:glycosyltransferase [Planctomycetota bacterium]